MKSLDVLEWMQALALSSGDEFAYEALELLGNVPFYDECQEIREALEKEAKPLEFADPEKLLDHFIDRSQLLDELKDTLEKAGFPGDDTSQCLDQALAELDDLRTQLAIVEGEDASRETLEYDL